MARRVVLIARAEHFSPHSVGKDAAILTAVAQQLRLAGVECLMAGPEEHLSARWPDGPLDGCLSMGRDEATLAWLERQQMPVVNAASAVRLCNRRALLMQRLEARHIAVPPLFGDDGYWVKRGDGCAECAADVQYAADRDTAEQLAAAMRQRGITAVDLRAHVVGDLVKCYGVSGTGFFRYYYPGDDGDWKFGDEQHNGAPRHYPFCGDRLQQVVSEAARVAGLDVYGVDCIVRPDGSVVLIDLNDWPSFSRCRDDAAKAIAQRSIQLMEKKQA